MTDKDFENVFVHKASSDMGMSIPYDSPCIMYDKTKGFCLYIPEKNENDVVSPETTILGAVFMLLHDEDWVEETIKEAFGDDV